MLISKMIVGVGCALLAVPAFAGVGEDPVGSAEVDGLGGPVIMRGKAIDGVFGAGEPNFTSAALSTFHSDVQSDGIVTDGKVTFLVAMTDAGLSWLALVDDENQPGEFDTTDSILGISTTGPSTSSIFVNDDDTDVLFRQDLGNGTTLAAGFFNWDSEREGDGFSWGSLEDGDFVSFLFTDEGPAGLDEPDVYQFLSWNGDRWKIVATADLTGNDQFGFSFNVVPTPAALAVLGLVGLARRRSRG